MAMAVPSSASPSERHTKTEDTGGLNIWPLPAPGLGDVDIVVAHLVFIRPIAKALFPPRLHTSPTSSRALPAACRAATSKSTTPAPVQSRGNREILSPLRHNTYQTRGHDRPSFAKAVATDWTEGVHVIVDHYIAGLFDPVLGLCAPQNPSPPAALASVL